jgi:Transposase IS200 like
MSRGNRREEIFRDDLDRDDFLKTLGAACQKTGWQVHAYCLMSNHFHLVIGFALPNYDEFEMNRPTLRNGIMDACLQSASSIKSSALCQK